jgi:hypothetical protein
MLVFNRSTLSGIAILFLLTGCGGGGDGDDGDDGSGDTDGDGLADRDEIELYKTSPVLADTDGDGFSDYDEIIEFGFDPSNNRYKFNPLIADIPKVAVVLTSDPDIDLIYTDSEGVTVTTGTSREVTNQSTLITTNTSTNGTKVEDQHTAGGELEVDEKGAPSGKLSYEYVTTSTRESTSGWTQTQIDDNKQVFAESEIIEDQRNITTSGGSIAYSVTIQNEGDIAFTLTSLTLSAQGIDPDFEGRFKPVGNLDLDTTFSSFPATSIGPGGAAQNLVFANRNLDIGTAKDLLENSSGLITEVAAYEVVDGDGRPYVHDETAIAARTAMILIEYAPTAGRSQEKYVVATNADPSAFGINVREAMQDILGIPYATNGGILTEVRNVAAEAATNGEWLLLHIYDSGPDRVVDEYNDSTPYNFDSLELKAGEVLHLVHINDADNDGLFDRQESIYRTDPLLFDTDGDGLLSDLDEVTAQSISIDGEAVDVRSDPTLIDGDGDGISDLNEYNPISTSSLPSNPLSTDTDGDRLADGIDLFRATTDLFDITDLDTVFVRLGSPTVTLTWNIPTDRNNITKGVLWLSYKNSDPSQAIPEPDTVPTDGDIYAPGPIGGNGWEVIYYSDYNTTPPLGPAESFVETVDPLASGEFKYIAYINVDTNNDGTGDIYVRSTEEDRIPINVPTTRLTVEVLGIDLNRCRDYQYTLAATTANLLNDYSCELYWQFTASGSLDIIPVLLDRKEVDATQSLLRPTRPTITVSEWSVSPIIEWDVPRVLGQCRSIRAKLRDSDDTKNNDDSGDERRTLTRTWCYEPAWENATGAVTTQVSGTLRYGNFNPRSQKGASDRTKLTVRYSYTVTPNLP